MATEFTVLLEDRPGTLADLSEALAHKAVNILAIHATPCPSQGIVQFIPDHAEAAVEALREANLRYTTHEVLLVKLVHQPGSLAQLARALGNAGINVNSLYITMNGQVVLDTSDLVKAQEVTMSLGLR